nr:hypothetical protein [Tanacetum cinerariifolium]
MMIYSGSATKLLFPYSTPQVPNSRVTSLDQQAPLRRRKPYNLAYTSSGSLQMDEDDKIITLVGLHLNNAYECRDTWKVVQHLWVVVGFGYGGGGGKFHDDFSCKNELVNDSRLIDVKKFFTKPYEALEVLDMATLLEGKEVAEDGNDNASN